MRKILFAGLMIGAMNVQAQTSFVLEENNASATIANNGVFFNDPSISNAGYEIPKGSGNHTIYSMAFWFAGLDIGGQLKGACNRYDGMYDMYPGPIADDYSSAYYSDNFSESIWKVTKAEIETHMEYYTVSGYEPVDAIANWPGNGDASEGVAEQLAPYVDVNGDMIYNPLDGDYPYIQGDAAILVIMNDANGIHEVSGADPLNAEFHFMFYQYSSTDEDINNTTFMNAKVYNRSSSPYLDFHMASFNDYDLGSYEDDWVGSDSVRNMIYGYNATNTDASYGVAPPAFGTKLLNQTMGVGMSYQNSGGSMGDPNNIIEFYNYMRAIWKDGTPLTYGGSGYASGTDETNCMFTGDPETSSGWTEGGAGNPPNDKRMVISTEALTLGSGEYLCLDFAFIFSNGGDSNLENVSHLKDVADAIQTYYDANIQPCSQIHVGIQSQEQLSADVYPNPSDGWLTVEAEGTYELNLFSMEGKLVESLGKHNGLSSVRLSVESGFYLLELSTGNARLVRKVQVVR